MEEDVKKVLKEIQPQLEQHGGGVDLVEVSQDGVVSVKLTGHCAGCPMAQQTLKMGIEKALMEKIPEVTEVKAV